MIKIPLSNPASYIAKRESLSISASASASRKLSMSNRLGSPSVALLKRSDSVDSSYGSFRERETERVSTYSNGNSLNAITEAHAAIAELAKRDNILSRINSNKLCRAAIADACRQIDRRTLPIVDHDLDDVEYILSGPDPISAVLTSILDQEVNSIIEASPQTKIALVGSKLLRQFKNSSASNQHSSSDLLRASIGRSNSINSNNNFSVSSSPSAQSPFILGSLPMRINTSSFGGGGFDSSNPSSASNSIAGSPSMLSVSTSLPRSTTSFGGQTSPSKTSPSKVSMHIRKVAEESKTLSFDNNDGSSGTSFSASNNCSVIPSKGPPGKDISSGCVSSSSFDINSNSSNKDKNINNSDDYDYVGGISSSSINNNNNNNNNNSNNNNNNSSSNNNVSRPTLVRGNRAEL
jgi:hypothetical protein